MDNLSEREIQQLFGARLRALRHNCKLSQEELAYSCQLDRSYVGQVERGERNVSLINIVKLARGLGVAPHETMMFFSDAAREGNI